MTAKAIQLYNTRTQKLEAFEPLDAGKVRLYGCGLTTYDHAHAGHARANTTFDILVRFLRASGLEVTFVRNITDVDDKILARAKELGREPMEFSSAMAAVNDAELRSIGCTKPDHEPKVSESIPDIIALVVTLIEKGVAYVAKTPVGNDVYFSVRSYAPYGKLSHRKIDDLLAGARVEQGDVKRDPLDFALWKASDASAWGWDSPWGKGRPGWHIECSAMAARYLGPHFDIHCGGMDLIFPHHENEIAQSEAAWGPEFARYWVHNGFLTVDQEKMSKSLGNFVTIKDVLERNDAEGLRYFILGTHYRGPLSFEVDRHPDGRVVFSGIDEAERRVEYLYQTKDGLEAASAGAEGEPDKSFAAHVKTVSEAADRVLDALGKDLNTPVALAVIGELAKAGNEIVTQIAKLAKDPAKQAGARTLAARAKAALEAATAPMGLMQASSSEFWERTKARRMGIRKLEAATIDSKIAERRAARDAKDFARSDAIRDELAAIGVEILDSKTGTSWRVVV